ncbi:MAG: myo-inositol-1(or 4)-monophosphatase [Candidatus Azotimanducaceae bacterium]|jgi:myo-inositol-1(or 4)-monophosphatase
MDIEKEFADLKEVIIEAGKLAREYFDTDSEQIEHKSDQSVVTEVDKNIETALITHIRERFPDDTIVGEEHGSHEGSSSFVWHIDPIDGSGNFVRKVPFCCVSVARLGDGPEDSFALIYNPITGHMFASLMEEGVYINEGVTSLRAGSLEGEKQVISLGYGREKWMKVARYKLFEALGMKFGKCTAYGSAALELAYLSANRIDGQLTLGLSTYDYAAGLFLVKAAGGSISVFEDGVWKLWQDSIKSLCDVHGKILFCSHPDVHLEMRDFIGDPKQWAES